MSNIFGLNDSEFWGKFPIRQEIEVLPADEVEVEGVHDQIIITSKNRFQKGRRLRLGWTITETTGIAVINTKGVAAGRKTK